MSKKALVDQEGFLREGLSGTVDIIIYIREALIFNCEHRRWRTNYYTLGALFFNHEIDARSSYTT